jgi:hypothetical protein
MVGTTNVGFVSKRCFRKNGEKCQTVMRFNPGNAHVCGLSRHRAFVGSGELDGDQTKAEGHEVLPRFGPLGRVMTYVQLV